MARSSASFKPGHVGGVPGGNPTWRPGVSGNPSGKSKQRRELEAAFADALQGSLSPADLADLLSAAARKGDAFAIARIADYYLPSLRNKETAEKEAAESAIMFDFELLSGDERNQLDELLKKCRKTSL